MIRPPIAFTANPLDRVSQLRKSEAWLHERINDAESRFLPLRELKALIRPGAAPAIAWQPGAALPAFIEGGSPWVLLGMADGRAHFVVDIGSIELPADWGKFIDVRTIAPQLAAGEAGILAQARSLLDWHARHRRCAVCGAETEPRDGGYLRQCGEPACKAQHFPRTDPVVIMLAIRGAHCLLGRQPRFLPGMYSALAGFIEPGESIEEAVRREVLEEAGVRTGAVRYIASQPWPFPSSLMIGCFAEAESEEIVIDGDELDEARWFSRREVKAMLENSLDLEASPRMPPPLSLAHQLGRTWLAD